MKGILQSGRFTSATKRLRECVKRHSIGQPFCCAIGDAALQDVIERTAIINAPVARVWRALGDHHEFGAWFRLAADRSFVVGAVVGCRCTYAGMEHLTWDMTIVAMEEERRFAFTWPAYYGEAFTGDTTLDPQLTVEFLLAPIEIGTRLTVRESGFSKLPSDRASTAYRLNEGGWDEQVKNIAAHVHA
jgi:uncharacterized protein YndB with AHSA1/START domain